MWHEPSEYCKVIILQLKIKHKLKKEKVEIKHDNNTIKLVE